MMEKLKDCPLCGSENFSQETKVQDYSTSKEVFTICVCNSCKLLFTNPRPNQENIGRYYDNPEYISHTNKSSDFFSWVYQRIRDHALSLKLKWIKGHLQEPIKNLLDYGSGTGEFMQFAKADGCNVVGIEIAEKPRLNAVEKYGLDVYAPSDISKIKDGTQDVITMWHVLEHLPDLNNTVDTLFAKLRKGGVLVIAVPNHESWDANIYQSFWAAWDVPIHFYHFSKSSMEAFAERKRLELLKIQAMPFDAYYVALLSEKYKHGKMRWFPAIANGFISNLKGGKTNTSSLAYIFKKK